MSILDFIKRQILRYRDLLANLSRRNKELFYRESRGHCINLSKTPKVDESFDELIAEKFTPLRIGSPLFQKLISDSNLDLSTSGTENKTTTRIQKIDEFT